MSAEKKVLVVGTTPDYIHWIRQYRSGQALFLTDPVLRRQAKEPAPPSEEEILCDLSDYTRTHHMLQCHLSERGLQLNGIACYDCESMELAAFLAQTCNLPYPCAQAVKNCRNKYLSKMLWQQHGLGTPKAELVSSLNDATQFFSKIQGPCILKPLSGSGSELIFFCETTEKAAQNFLKIVQGLNLRQTHRLYSGCLDDTPSILAEEWVQGNEYSCDFIIEHQQVELIRLTRKILSGQAPFGTTMGYQLENDPVEINRHELVETLRRSAAALGLDRALCMVDFILHDGGIVLLELAPRPGGDCLPFLLRQSYGLDMLTFYFDFCRQSPRNFIKPPDNKALIGLKLHARNNGVIKSMDIQALQQDNRVREIHIMRRPGHFVNLPPADYDSWILGHVIFEPDADGDLKTQCQTLIDKLSIEVE